MTNAEYICSHGVPILRVPCIYCEARLINDHPEYKDRIEKDWRADRGGGRGEQEG